MNDHPCFHCRLADCDETSRGCEIRVLLARYKNKLRKGRHGEIVGLERMASAIVKSDRRRRKTIAAEEVVA
ncbi:hypothetical protein [Oricola sp.]|uniref:hypothetical protein n=1 Tax=Oricola sp. TaxID=1979950 RepID=UPI003BA9CD66